MSRNKSYFKRFFSFNFRANGENISYIVYLNRYITYILIGALPLLLLIPLRTYVDDEIYLVLLVAYATGYLKYMFDSIITKSKTVDVKLYIKYSILSLLPVFPSLLLSQYFSSPILILLIIALCIIYFRVINLYIFK